MLFLLFFVLFFNVNSTFSLNLCDEKVKKPNSIFNFRIIGGNFANSKTGINWMGKLITIDENNEGIMCGATAIDSNWILTAAHCASQLKRKSYVIFKAENGKDEITVVVNKSFLHPKYDNKTASNDIALLETKTNLFSKGISAVCILKSDDSILKLYSNGYVLGYGLILEQSSTPSSYILEPTEKLELAKVPIIPESSCRATWDQISFRSVFITKNQICAGSYLHGTAPGDSGGPLLIRTNNGVNVQIGITSFGADGLSGLIDQRSFPGVYTRVSKYVPWIQNTIQQNSYSPFKFSFFGYFSFLIFFLFIFY